MAVIGCARIAHADDVVAPSSRPDPVEEIHRTRHLLALGAGALVFASTELLFKDQLSPDRCRWCEPPGFDADVRNALVWDDPSTARRLSNFTGYALQPLLAAGLFVLATGDAPGERVRLLVDDAIPITEAVVYTQLLTQVAKFGVGRQRPYARFAADAPPPDNEDNLSFFSGHSSLVFSIAVSSGLVAHRRGYRLEPVIWASGLSLAAFTAYLRIAADRHYLSDVLVGSSVGALGGYLVPTLTGSLPGRFTVTPMRDGVAITGSF
ncbi:MAG TPA: phosphatase PAP2 family protein [Kofleriaceae bacterium]|nr:phosphatase PAP2 family protein [Kofleriaceae bacterium]